MASYEKLIASRLRTTKQLGSKNGSFGSRFGSGGTCSEKKHHVESGGTSSNRWMTKSKKASTVPIVKQTSHGFCIENAGYIRWHAWNPNQSMSKCIFSKQECIFEYMCPAYV